MRFSCNKKSADIDVVSSGVDPVLHLPVNAPSLSPICKALDLTASSKKYLTCYLLVKCTFPEIVLPSEMWFLTMYTPTAEKLQYVKQIPPWSSVADHWWAPLPGVKMPTLGVWWNHPNLLPIWLKHTNMMKPFKPPATNMIETFIHIPYLPPRWWKNPYIFHQRDGKIHRSVNIHQRILYAPFRMISSVVFCINIDLPGWKVLS